MQTEFNIASCDFSTEDERILGDRIVWGPRGQESRNIENAEAENEVSECSGVSVFVK